MTNKEAMQMALDTLSESKRSHYYCEDRFYSCPMHEEGCADALEGDECNCGANFVNETIEKAIEALRTALAQPEKEWVGLTYKERCELWNIASQFSPESVIMHDFAKDIEARLRELNT